MKKRVFAPVLLSCILVVLTCLVLSVGSCTFTSNGITMISGDYVAPTLGIFTLKNESSAIITFSQEVDFPLLEYYELPSEISDYKEHGNAAEAQLAQKSQLLGVVTAEKQVQDNGESSTWSYLLKFPELTLADKKYILSGVVKDDIGNTLSFTLGFSGYNSRVPQMIFSEISTEYADTRTEFIEFYVLEDGNLAGIILHSASDGVEKDVIFPSVEVKKGEYVVLHMRTVEEGAKNELGDNLSLSNSRQSSSEGRDIWIEGKETRISRNDVLLLRRRLNGTLLDVLAYTEGLKPEWPKDAMLAYIQEATEANLWEGGVEVSLAASTEGIAGTRTLSRQNIPEIASLFDNGERHFVNSKDDWIIVARSNLSPGKENSTKPHIE